jgi:hypothetical protein
MQHALGMAMHRLKIGELSARGGFRIACGSQNGMHARSETTDSFGRVVSQSKGLSLTQLESFHRLIFLVLSLVDVRCGAHCICGARPLLRYSLMGASRNSLGAVLVKWVSVEKPPNLLSWHFFLPATSYQAKFWAAREKKPFAFYLTALNFLEILLSVGAWYYRYVQSPQRTSSLIEIIKLKPATLRLEPRCLRAADIIKGLEGSKANFAPAKPSFKCASESFNYARVNSNQQTKKRRIWKRNVTSN